MDNDWLTPAFINKQVAKRDGGGMDNDYLTPVYTHQQKLCMDNDYLAPVLITNEWSSGGKEGDHG